MSTIKKFLFKLLTAAVFVLPVTSYAACGSNDKKITFTDGATACLNEFNFLNIKGLMKPFPNESYSSKSQSIRTYAVAVSADPLLCPFEHSMQWDHSTGDNDRRAINACESRMPAAIQTYGKSESVQNCKCEVLIDNGKSNFTRSAFEQKTKLYERQIALGFRPIQIVEAQIKEQADREAEAKRQAEAKKREDDRLIAMKERAEREAKEEAERKKNAPPPIFAMRRALLIGNDTYKYADVLKNAREDARAMANELKGFGYDVTLRLDQSQKEMQATLRDFRESIKEGDEVLFYFSGHAVEIDGKNYLTPIDTIGMNQNQLADDSIDLKSSVLDPFTRKKAKLTLALIDACRNNPFLKTSLTKSVVGGSKGLAPTTPATGQLIVYSAGSGQTALDRLGESDNVKNGLFTRVFLQEMKKVDLPIDRVIKNVRTEVVRLARTIGHDQVPAIYDEVVGDFYFKK
jgi:hypothetical protein